MLTANDVVFFLDVDNTLLDNDRFGKDLGDRLEQSFGAFEKARYWSIIAKRREEMGLVDYLGSLQEFRSGLDEHAELLEMSEFLLEYPFAERLFPRSLQAVAHLSSFGRPVVLSMSTGYIQPSLTLALCEMASSSLPAFRCASIQFHNSVGSLESSALNG